MNAHVASTRRKYWIAGLASVVLTSCFAQATLKKEDVTVSNQAIVEAVQRGDFNAITAVPPDPTRLAEDLAKIAAQFNDQASQIATILVGRYRGPQSTSFLIAMARSTHMQAAVTAATTLGELTEAPPAVEIARSIPQAKNPLVRGRLYLVLGRSREGPALTALRTLLATEQDPDVRTKATAAAARLGGDVERAAFMQRVKSATADNAKDVYDELLYVGDVRFAKGLLPWLDQRGPVTRIGGDAEGRNARLCDLAVWTSMRLGVTLSISATQLDNYDDATIQETRVALQQLAAP